MDSVRVILGPLWSALAPPGARVVSVALRVAAYQAAMRSAIVPRVSAAMVRAERVSLLTAAKKGSAVQRPSSVMKMELVLNVLVKRAAKRALPAIEGLVVQDQSALLMKTAPMSFSAKMGAAHLRSDA